MQRWERRLKDLAILLKACGASYFDPERFRLNSNQFLTTARTVSFLFQKDKAFIENFEEWHRDHVRDPWHADEIMKWSIASRNTIEKEGDLNSYSKINATLIYSYLEDQDQYISIDKMSYLSASIKKLTRFARSQLPSGVSDGAVIRIERLWIADTLPDLELLQAFRYIYTRLFEACRALAQHINITPEGSIPLPTTFDEISTDSRGICYISLNSFRIGKLVAHEQVFDKDLPQPPWLQKLYEETEKSLPNSLAEIVAFHEKIAYANFMAYGNHLAMLWLYDENFKPINFVGTIPENQADKFIFWRSVSDRIQYLKAKYLIWVSEAWLREGANLKMTKPIRNLPIVGEILQVVATDGGEQYITSTWNIRRESQGAPPTLERQPTSEEGEQMHPYYLIPARRALAKVHNLHTLKN